MEGTDRVGQLLEEFGLTDFAEVLLPAVRPVSYLVVADLGVADHGPGRSRFAGDPDLPVGTGWPTGPDGAPLTFVLQIDLSHVRNGPLPRDGLLSLFVGDDQPASDVPTRILLVPADAELVRTPAPEVVESETFEDVRPSALQVVSGFDLPRWATDDHETLTDDMDQAQEDAYDEVVRSLRPRDRRILGRLFGHASGIGHDPRPDAHVVRDVDPRLLYDPAARAGLDLGTPARQWQHLVTVNSCSAVDLTIWDAGYLQVLIKQDDLVDLRFDRTYAAIESS